MGGDIKFEYMEASFLVKAQRDWAPEEKNQVVQIGRSMGGNNQSYHRYCYSHQSSESP